MRSWPPSPTPAGLAQGEERTQIETERPSPARSCPCRSPVMAFTKHPSMRVLMAMSALPTAAMALG